MSWRKKPKIWLVMAVFLPAMVGTSFAGRIITVDDDGLADFNNIQAAIDAAVDGDVVIVAPGTYTGDGNRDIDFKGRAITVKSENGPENCIIDCQGTKTQPHRGFSFHSREDSSSVLDGFTIRNGYANGYAIENGGGIYCRHSSPTVKNCIISNNSAFWDGPGGRAFGGGMQNYDRSRPIVTNCTFSGNSASWGGGMSNSVNSGPKVTNCTFSGNSAGLGGGMFNTHGSNPNVKNCMFSGNSGRKGGGMWNYESYLTLINCTFSGNRSSGRLGTGIYNEAGIPRLTNCILWGNGATDESSQFYNESSTPVINYCCIQGWTGSLGGTGNFGDDPLFARPAVGDYHLLPDSPCIDTGNPNGDYTGQTDIDGQPRIINGRVDIGADEFHPETPIIGVSPTEFYFSYGIGGPNPGPQILSVWNDDIGILNWQITEDCNWLDVSPASGQSSGQINEVIISIDVRDLDVGKHSCVLEVSDNNAINSPQYVTVNLDVKAPVIGVTPTEFDFVCPLGGPNPEPQILSVWNDFIGRLNWQITEDCNWLDVWPASGQSLGEVDEVVISVDANGLGQGQYSYLLTVSDPNAINSPQYVTVNLDVRAPIIGVTPSELNFLYPKGGQSPGPQILSVWNDDIGMLNWRINEDCNWLDVWPTSGQSSGEVDEVVVSVDANGLDIGMYNCILKVSDSNAINSPKTVNVILHRYGINLEVPRVFPTIQAAIDAAVDGNTVVIAPGTYTGPGNRDIDFLGKAITVRSTNPNDPNVVAETVIDCNGTKGDPHRGFNFINNEDGNSVLAGLTITNGYAGYGGAIFCSNASPMLADCNFSGNSAEFGAGLYGDSNSSPTLTNCTFSGNSARYGGGMYNREGSSPTLTGCTFSGNSATSSSGYGRGGGMYNYYSNPNLINCTFSGNSATGEEGRSYGGVMYNSNSSLTLMNCTFIGNSTDYRGGVMYNTRSSLMLTNCTFSGNSVVGERARGGGMYNYKDNSLTLSNCTFIGNSAVGILSRGGGMYNSGSSLTLTNCTFSGNQAERYGGGMYNVSSDPNLTNCTFSQNSARSGGGMYNREGSNQTLTNCTFIENSAGYYGGGMDNRDSSPTLTNCTFSGNSAEEHDGGGMANSHISSPNLINCTFSGNSAEEYGGGMRNVGGCSPNLINCTFSGNSAGEYGGGLYNYMDSNATLSNCIFWGDTAAAGPEIALRFSSSPSSVEVSYSDIEGGEAGVYVDPSCTIIWGAGNIDDDPCFVSPGYWVDANDPNIIVEPNDPNAVWINGDYHLLEDSPCINAGDPNFVAGPNETDIDGEPRVWDGRVDMGADEFVPALQVAMKFTPQALNPKSKGNWMKAHFVLPEGFVVEDVDVSRPAWIEPLGIESDYMNVFVNEDGLVEIEAAFSRAEFCAAGPVDGTVTVIGVFGTGQYFYGTDTIKIITGNFKYLGVLASHWLEQDCGKPDWCSGLDLDQDSAVNFVDFAMFDGCCIEIIKK